MAVQAEMLELVRDHAIDLLGRVPDPCEALSGAARGLAGIGLGVPIVDLDDAETFLDRLIADNTLLCIRASERGSDFADLLETPDFADLIVELVRRLGFDEQETRVREPAWLLERSERVPVHMEVAEGVALAA